MNSWRRLNPPVPGYDGTVSDTPGVPADPDDPDTDELPVTPDDGSGDRDEIEEGIGELLIPDPPPEGGAISETEAEPPG